MLVSVLLLCVCLTLVTGQQTCSEHGAIQLIGIKTDTFAAGRLEICVDGFLRAVYDTSWGDAEARLVCTQMGFPAEGAFPCTDSCLGASSLEQGYTEFIACAGASRLIDCGDESEDGLFLDDNAGVICTMSVPSPELAMTQCPMQSPNDASAPCRSSAGESAGDQNRVGANSSCTAIGAVLGVLLAISTLALVGVVIGWVWFCHRHKLISKQSTTSSSKDHPENTLDNPTYSVTGGNTVLSVQYSSSGPANTPLPDHTPVSTFSQQEVVEYQEVRPEEGMPYEVPGVAPEEDMTYEVSGVGPEEDMTYEVPGVEPKEGMAYEVPIQTMKRSGNEN